MAEGVITSEMGHIEIVQLLVDHLPDTKQGDVTWEWAWNELSDDAQEAVKNARRAAWEFVSRHQLDKLVRMA